MSCRCCSRLASLLVLLALGGLALACTSQADQVERDPATVETGTVCQLIHGEDGTTEARAACMVPFALDRVWQVVTGYERYGDICTCLRPEALEHDPAGVCRLSGMAHTGFGGSVPFAFDLVHRQDLDHYSVAWDGSTDWLPVNRGAWHLRPAGEDHTLVALRVAVRVRWIPGVVQDSQTLGRVREVVAGVARRLEEGGDGEPW